jgi:hypothetical protein
VWFTEIAVPLTFSWFFGPVNQGYGLLELWGESDVMSRGAYTFKQRDVTRALKATLAAGIDVARIEIDKEGRIVILAHDRRAG